MDLLPITLESETWCTTRHQEIVELAIRLHWDDHDKAGAPYLYHLHAVAGAQCTYVGRVIAWLHDAVEDGHTTIGWLYNYGMPAELVQRIEVLTRLPGERYMDYITRTSTDAVTCSVKLADLTHNMQLTRLPQITDKDLQRLAKYHRAYIFLKGIQDECHRSQVP